MTLTEFLLSRYRLDGDNVIGPNGLVAGTDVGRGYRGTGVKFDGKWRRVLMHRLVFLLAHGYLPTQVDHINGDPSDNRVTNLRAADGRLNQANRRACSSTNAKGVYLRVARRAKPKFEAVCDGKYVGLFDTLEEASAAYNAAARAAFGEFARVNP
jgi:hypothetical protein